MDIIRTISTYGKTELAVVCAAVSSFMGRTVQVLNIGILDKRSPHFAIYFKVKRTVEDVTDGIFFIYLKARVSLKGSRTVAEISADYMKALKTADKGNRRLNEEKRRDVDRQIKRLAWEIFFYMGISKLNREGCTNFLRGKLLGTCSEEYKNQQPCAFADLYFIREMPCNHTLISEQAIKERVEQFIDRFKNYLGFVVSEGERKDVVQKLYGDSFPVKLTSCEIVAGSDPHNGSQVVCRLTYGEGTKCRKVYYKPRSLQAEADIGNHIASLFASINAALKQKGSEIQIGTTRFLTLKGGGYVESVKYDGNLTSSKKDGIRYARNFGAMLYLCEWLGICDMHAANYIIRKNMPVFIDFESCFIPTVAMIGKNATGFMENERRSKISTNIHAGFDRLDSTRQRELIQEGESIMRALIQENPELRKLAVKIQQEVMVRFIPIDTATLNSLASSTYTDEDYARRIREKFIHAANGKRARLGITDPFTIDDEEKFREALINCRKNMDIALFTLSPEGYMYIQDVRIGHLYDANQFWENALNDPVRPLKLLKATSASKSKKNKLRSIQNYLQITRLMVKPVLPLKKHKRVYALKGCEGNITDAYKRKILGLPIYQRAGIERYNHGRVRVA